MLARKTLRSAAVMASVWLLAVAAFPLRPSVAQTARLPGEETLQTLSATVIPPRDRIDLAKRLLGVKTIPPPPVNPREFEVGDTREFMLQNLDTTDEFTITGRLAYKTPHVYMWFERGFTPDLKAVQRNADNFEKNIYPRVHALFGTERSPGVDGDVHLHIVHARNLGSSVAGYFSSDSELPKLVVPTSNEGQMFFINLDTMANTLGSDYYEAVIAHEFQHMVHSNQDDNEVGWIDEGMAELSAALTTDGFGSGFAPTFLADPATQLNTWGDAIGDSGAHYGAAYLFAAYLLERFGEDVIRQIVANPRDGFDGILATLRQIGATDKLTGQPITIPDLFADWQLANLLNDPQVGDGRFAYPTQPRLPTPPFSKAVVGTPTALKVNQFGTLYLRVNTPGSYTFKVEGRPTVSVLPTAAYSGQYFWWSNRGDQNNTRLTQAFDLSQVAQATLDFWAWHAIEDGWDFGYIMVSTDSGQTWTALPAVAGSTTSKVNNPYGPAFTGFSKGGKDARSAAWTRFEVDLKAYAGQKILLRFEYITDDAFNLPGWAIDDVQIPEIGYASDFEQNDGGWQAEGFVRIDNVLPQRYLIQAVSFGKQTIIQRLLDVNGGLSGEWQVKIGGDVTEMVITVSGMTEFTTEPGTITYTLTKQ